MIYVRRRLQILLALLLFTGSVAVYADWPQAYKASYEFKRSGARVERVVELTGEQDGFSYRIVSKAKGIAALAKSEPVTETGRFAVVDGKLRPKQYILDDGSESEQDDVSIKFDWDAGNATLVGGGKTQQIKLDDQTLDPYTVELAVRKDLANGGEPGPYRVIEDDRVRTYSYSKIGSKVVKAGKKEYQTVEYKLDRESSRVMHYWFAPELDYLPVRFEQRHKGKSKGVTTLVKLNN